MLHSLSARSYSPADRSTCLGIFDSNVPDSFSASERADFEAFLDSLPGPYFVVEDESGRAVACGGYAVNPGTTCHRPLLGDGRSRPSARGDRTVPHGAPTPAYPGRSCVDGGWPANQPFDASILRAARVRRGGCTPERDRARAPSLYHAAEDQSVELAPYHGKAIAATRQSGGRPPSAARNPGPRDRLRARGGRPRDRSTCWRRPRAGDRSARAIAQAQASCAAEIRAGRLSLRCVAIEDFELEPGEEPFDLAFAARVGALDGRHRELEEQALRRIARALRADGRLFIDGGDPLREIRLRRRSVRDCCATR